MNRFCALGAVLLLSTAVPATADTYGGPDPGTDQSDTDNILLYPNGQYGLPSHVIRLHKPKHRRAASALHKPNPTVAAAQPAATPQYAPSQMPEDSAARLVGAASPVTPPPAKPHRPTTPPASAPASPPAAPSNDDSATSVPFSFGGGEAAPPARRVARATPPPPTTSPSLATGLKRLTVVPFSPGNASPAASDVNAIHELAASLNSQLSGGSAKVELEAYGGARGDKSSDARRLSLKRALVVRELLIEDGIPSEKIDVRALGGADSGELDRVDIFVKA